jgi:hypothetical protein
MGLRGPGRPSACSVLPPSFTWLYRSLRSPMVLTGSERRLTPRPVLGRQRRPPVLTPAPRPCQHSSLSRGRHRVPWPQACFGQAFAIPCGPWYKKRKRCAPPSNPPSSPRHASRTAVVSELQSLSSLNSHLRIVHGEIRNVAAAHSIEVTYLCRHLGCRPRASSCLADPNGSSQGSPMVRPKEDRNG